MSEKRPNFGLDEGMKKKLKLDGSASGTLANQETLKPSRGKGKRKRNQADEDSLKEQMWERSSSKDQTPTQSRSGSIHTTLLYRKRLTYEDVLTGRLTIPPESARIVLPK
ncbi:uncharacterized protein LOC109121889 [Vitis vinifera]|uniref:uncharacterized protein LOC109121889 n=1 Tax=Vitis vinifera TaxID=29760 RepID=UPI0008FED52C|nr:uncharacterized protein LOC109121889 [Vitis vinifera]|eukprot:XP_019073126.1 PREDICTED: uncharacterized protein LOC109121889 [Vitis vinifera]